jgi:hypothetical protein
MYRSGRIAAAHDLASRRSGNEALEGWMRDTALTADAMGAARTDVWTASDETVVGYFSLSPHEVRRETLPSVLTHRSPYAVPAIFLARPVRLFRKASDVVAAVSGGR